MSQLLTRVANDWTRVRQKCTKMIFFGASLNMKFQAMTVRDTHASQILITQKLKILKNQRLMMMLIPGANVTRNVRKMMNAASGTGSTQHQLENVNSLQRRPAVRKVAMKSTPA